MLVTVTSRPAVSRHVKMKDTPQMPVGFGSGSLVAWITVGVIVTSTTALAGPGS
jgi:hypothetical protein